APKTLRRLIWTRAPFFGNHVADWRGTQIQVSAMGRIGDSPRELADKHADMGKTVSGYLRRGLRLVENAARGYFPLA
ncbi:MAG: hypothetical protein EBT08_10030, partial [Betaproteobacteria bacterium]|nr:hypothetical protein [Betaproteobacteria bacterium]